MVIAGIDIGSNATRITISKAPKKGGFHLPDDMIHKYRFPCRLGDDVFSKGVISKEKIIDMNVIFTEIRNILKRHDVEKVKGVATSAFRDAKNGRNLLNTLSKKHSVPCSIISGPEEARLMSQGLLRRGVFKEGAAHLHIDIGGGSLELSAYHNGAFIFQKSLNLGTLRLIENTDSGALVSDHLKQLELIDEVFENFDSSISDKFKIHGTGGNFKRLGTLRQYSFNKKSDNKLKRDDIDKMIELYSKHPGKELSKHSPIKEENSALIMPSLLMIKKIISFWPAQKIKIPKLSLSHVLLDELC